MEQKYYDSIDHQVFTKWKKDSKEGISYNSLEGAKSRKHRMGPHILTHQVCNTKMDRLSSSSTDIPSDYIQLSKAMCK
jgi:hypothetical protein